MRTKMTPEQAKEARRQAAKRWYEKQRAAKMAQNGGAEPKRGRPKKEEAKAAAKKAPRRAAKKAVNSRAVGKKRDRGLAKLRKALEKAQARHLTLKAKADAAKAAVKAAKDAVKAYKAAN